MIRTAYDQPLADLLHRLNRVLRGEATCFRRGVSKTMVAAPQAPARRVDVAPSAPARSSATLDWIGPT
jgi:hypothetical protein